MSMKLIIFPLLIMFFAALLGQLVTTSELEQIDPARQIQGGQWGGNITVDGTAQRIESDEQFNFGIDPVSGAIAIIVTLIALGGVVGIQVLGSGLNSVSSMAIFKLTAFYSIWAIVAVLGIGTILAIPIFGWVIFFALTLAYTIGAIGQVSFSGGDV